MLRALPECDVAACNAGEFWVELDAFDAEEGILGGDEHRASFAGAHIEKNRALNRCERMKLLQPEIEQRAQNAGRDAVVRSEVGSLVRGTASDDIAGEQARGFGAMCDVKGMDGGSTRSHGQGRPPRIGKSAGSISISVREISGRPARRFSI